MDAGNCSDDRSLTGPEVWLEQHGDALFRYALLRIGNRTVAEDLVQETLIAALKGSGTFSGRSAERTWLIGILKHKIIDAMRKTARERPLSEIEAAAQSDRQQFNQHGLWQVGPRKWGRDPRGAFEQAEFWDVFERCLSKLPPRTAHAFVLREMEELAGEEVCKILEVTPTNLWTLLHRARAGVRKCLEAHWFSRE